MKNKDRLEDVSEMTRLDVVPYYVNLIIHINDRDEVCRINQLILSKWSSSGLLFIKEKAWKIVNDLSKK